MRDTTAGSKKVGQFSLLRSRRFLPFFITQFSGALNDNIYKNALLVVVVSSPLAANLGETNVLTNVAAGLFILPFFLFSALAGQLADKFDKATIIRRIKLAEIAIMVGAGLAWFYHAWWGLMFLLFAMGTQSAFFGPIKYSIIPQHLDRDELVAGNAQTEMGTFVAILLGTLGGSLLGGLDNPELPVALTVIILAALGWWASRFIPAASPSMPHLPIEWNPVREIRALFDLVRGKRVILLSIVGISWFWLLGASYLTQVPNFAVSVLGGGSGLIAALLCAFVVGVASGSLLCDRLSGHHVEIGLVPLASFGLSVFGIDLFYSAVTYKVITPFGFWNFVIEAGGWRILLDIALIGLSGGLYIVPLYANVQVRSPDGERARVIAFNNILNALFMVLASLLGVGLLSTAGLTLPQFFLVITLMNIAVVVFIFYQVPEFTMRFLIWLLSHSMYRVSHRGLNNIPDRGAALLTCNHVSFVDALLLAGAVRRPIRFVMYKPIFSIPVLNFIFRTGRAIPICSPKEDSAIYEAAMEAIAEGLEQGDLLCIFPEGKLSADGDIDQFRPGVERIVARTPVPVVPMALQGLWGSFFSRSERGAFTRPFRRVWSRVSVVAAEALAPEQVRADDLRQRVLALRGDNK